MTALFGFPAFLSFSDLSAYHEPHDKREFRMSTAIAHTSIFTGLDWATIRAHYEHRVAVSNRLRKLYGSGVVHDFVWLALGIADDAGNYSSAEHHLAPRILGNVNAERRIFDLAGKFLALKDAKSVPDLIQHASLNYLQIGVGSELSCMVNPDVCWVCNVRTIWTHIAWEHGTGKAEEALKLFRAGDADSEMAYTSWAEAYHPLLLDSLIDVAKDADTFCKKEGVSPGTVTFLWADAIAGFAYGKYHD